MWRIHLSTDDTRRIRVASDIDPLWELAHSVQLIDGGGPVIFGPWRRRVRVAGANRWSVLRRLLPPKGYFVDFLTPIAGLWDLRNGVEQVMRTPQSVLRHDIAQLASAGLPDEGWMRALATGESETLRGLGGSLLRYHDSNLRPYWGEVRGQVAEELARLRRALCEEGVDGLLSSLGDLFRWEPPVLVLAGKPTERDLYVDGRGLLVQPSFFAFGDVSILDVPGQELVLVYPVRHRLGWWDARSARPRMDVVLGRTRAEVLEYLSDGERTTGELAHRLHISPASASEQAKALREAGLIVSHRDGKHVLHALSGAARTLLGQ